MYYSWRFHGRGSDCGNGLDSGNRKRRLECSGPGCPGRRRSAKTLHRVFRYPNPEPEHARGGTHLTFGYIKQFPTLPPDAYSQSDLDYIVPRVLELTYTAWDLKPFAEDLGYEGPPFPFDPERRHRLKCELDADYARLYGLSRDELRYILDPADAVGPDDPSETFRVLKNSEIKQFDEYGSQRLVLKAFDDLPP
jgi:hypothetical protein